jgi:sortase (surface protein transpeptidase)
VAIITIVVFLSPFLITSLARAATPEETGLRRAYILPTRTIHPTPVTVGAVVQAESLQNATKVPTAPNLEPQGMIAMTDPATPTPPRISSDLYIPVRIRIPAIAVDAQIQPIGLTTAHEIAVPKENFAVGWYRYSPSPGEIGNALFTGHLDTASGAPAIFWRLKELSAGHQIQIETDGKALNFVVESVTSYTYIQAPLAEIYADDGRARITLITCSGSWQQDKKDYDRRLVVSAVLSDPNSSDPSNADREP